jgi:hypothetical protein
MANGTNDNNSAFKPSNKTNERQTLPAPINQIPKEEREEIDTIGWFDIPAGIDKSLADVNLDPAKPDSGVPDAFYKAFEDKVLDPDIKDNDSEPMSATGSLNNFQKFVSEGLASQLFTEPDKFINLATNVSKDIGGALWDLKDQLVFTSPDKAREEAKMHQVYNLETDQQKSKQASEYQATRNAQEKTEIEVNAIHNKLLRYQQTQPHTEALAVALGLQAKYEEFYDADGQLREYYVSANATVNSDRQKNELQAKRASIIASASGKRSLAGNSEAIEGQSLVSSAGAITSAG